MQNFRMYLSDLSTKNWSEIILVLSEKIKLYGVLLFVKLLASI